MPSRSDAVGTERTRGDPTGRLAFCVVGAAKLHRTSLVHPDLRVGEPRHAMRATVRYSP